MQVDVIGDEIWADNQLVAMLTPSGATPSTAQEFRDCLEEGAFVELDPDEVNNGCTRRHLSEDAYGYECAVADIQRDAKKYARGGLLKLTDLAKLCKLLLEEGNQYETPSA